jgi:uncharacterized membrane protein YvlD (DUF360 family)
MRAVIWLGSAAIGLLVAKLVLDDMTIDAASFLFVVVIFSVMQAVLAPFTAKVTAQNASALLGGVGLLSTFTALLITSAMAEGMSISGLDTWVFASLIVWIVTMLGSFLLPLLVGRRLVGRARDRGRP